MAFEAEKRAIAKLIDTIGRAGLHSLFPKEFNFELVAFQLLKKNGTKWIDDKIFIFPVLPNSISRQQRKQSSVSQTFSGMTITSNPKFSPVTYTISGDFGLEFKTIPKGIFGPLLIEFSPLEAGFSLAKSALKKATRRTVFSSVIKTGYGCTQLLREIFDAATQVDKDGNPSILIFHNLFFGESFVISPDAETLSAQRLTTTYYLTFTAVAPSSIIAGKTEASISAKKLLRKFVANEVGVQAKALVLSLASKNKSVSKVLSPVARVTNQTQPTTSADYVQLSQPEQIVPPIDANPNQISPSLFASLIPDNVLSIEFAGLELREDVNKIFSGIIDAVNGQAELLAYYQGSSQYPSGYVDRVVSTISAIEAMQIKLSEKQNPTAATLQAQRHLSDMSRSLKSILNLGFLSKSDKLPGGYFANYQTTSTSATASSWIGVQAANITGTRPTTAARDLKVREKVFWDDVGAEFTLFNTKIGTQTVPIEDVLGSTVGQKALGSTIDRRFIVNDEGRLLVLDNEQTFNQAIEIITTAGQDADADITLPNYNLLIGNTKSTPLSLPIWISQLSGALQQDGTIAGFSIDDIKLENNRLILAISVIGVNGQITQITL